MTDSNQQELQKAFWLWYQHYEHKKIDLDILPFLKQELPPFKLGEFSWLKNARTGLFLSTQFMCQTLKISRSTYLNYEDGELMGSISLAKLSHIAEAMNCELIYAIRPKAKITFSNHVWNILSESAKHHHSLRCYDPKHRSKSIAAIAKRLMKDPKFKKSQGWSQRANKEQS